MIIIVYCLTNGGVGFVFRFSIIYVKVLFLVLFYLITGSIVPWTILTYSGTDLIYKLLSFKIDSIIGYGSDFVDNISMSITLSYYFCDLFLTIFVCVYGSPTSGMISYCLDSKKFNYYLWLSMVYYIFYIYQS